MAYIEPRQEPEYDESLTGLYVAPELRQGSQAQTQAQKSKGGLLARLRAYFHDFIAWLKSGLTNLYSWWTGKPANNTNTVAAAAQSGLNLQYAPPPSYGPSQTMPRSAQVELLKDQIEEDSPKPKDIINIKNFGFPTMVALAAYINVGEPPFSSLQLQGLDGKLYTIKAMFNPERPSRLALFKQPLYPAPGEEATPISKAESELWRDQVASAMVDLAAIRNRTCQYDGFHYHVRPSAPLAHEEVNTEPGYTRAPWVAGYAQTGVSSKANDAPAYPELPAYNPAARFTG